MTGGTNKYFRCCCCRGMPVHVDIDVQDETIEAKEIHDETRDDILDTKSVLGCV